MQVTVTLKLVNDIEVTIAGELLHIKSGEAPAYLIDGIIEVGGVGVPVHFNKPPLAIVKDNAAPAAVTPTMTPSVKITSADDIGGRGSDD